MGESDKANAELRRKIMGFIVSKAIQAVVELGVCDELADGAATVPQLASALGADSGALGRFLRVLAAEGLFTESPGDTFALTDLGALLRSDVPGSLRHFVALMAEDPSYLAWSRAEHSLRTGDAAFDVVFGSPLFDWLALNAEASVSFNRAQAGLVELRLLPLLERSWEDVGTVADIGGGNGVLIRTLLSEHSQLLGIVFDLPHVVAEAKRTLDRAGLSDRADCVGGDFFAEVPEGADVYVLAQILHDWDDEHAAVILDRCRAAMRQDSRLLILEQVIPDGAEPHPAKLLDLHMLVLLAGRERAETSWRNLLEASGFVLAEVAHGARSSLLCAHPAP